MEAVVIAVEYNLSAPNSKWGLLITLLVVLWIPFAFLIGLKSTVDRVADKILWPAILAIIGISAVVAFADYRDEPRTVVFEVESDRASIELRPAPGDGVDAFVPGSDEDPGHTHPPADG